MPAPDGTSEIAFTGAALRYWLSVFPRVRRELHRLRSRALGIPDPALRELALAALAKRGNIEGAAAFAAFVPRRRRGATVRALVAFQAIYNYTDMLAEQPHGDPVANARRLHEALLVALDPSAAQLDYYARHPQREDGGYLRELVESCRMALRELPCHLVVSGHARRAAARIVAYQSLSLGREQDERDALERWARAQTPAGSDLEWWETAAAGGSSLSVHALIAAAAATDPAVGLPELDAIEEASYFPWIGALHSLLDSFVDEAEDARTRQLSLIGCYASREDAARRMRRLAERAMCAARELPRGREHAVLVAGMAGYYLSAAGAGACAPAMSAAGVPAAGVSAAGVPAPAMSAAGVSAAGAPIVSGGSTSPGALAEGVREGIGGLIGPSLLVFKARRIGNGRVGTSG